MKAEICRALRKLGITQGKVHIENLGGNAVVYLNGSYFGIYDPIRKTFVD